MRSKADEMASLVERTAQKRKKKEKQKPSSSEETGLTGQPSSVTLSTCYNEEH